MRAHEPFNRSALSRFLNGSGGRFFRLVAGAGFLFVGYVFHYRLLGEASMAWGLLAMTAGAFDVCYISAVLGAPPPARRFGADNSFSPRAASIA